MPNALRERTGAGGGDLGWGGVRGGFSRKVTVKPRSERGRKELGREQGKEYWGRGNSTGAGGWL